MGRNKEADQPVSNPKEAKKYRDESFGYLKNGDFDTSLLSLNKLALSTTSVCDHKVEVSAKTPSSHHDDHSSGVDTDASSHTSHYITPVRKMDSTDNAKAQARSILGPTKDAEFLQSFVRVGVGDEEEEEEEPVAKPSISKRGPTGHEDTAEGKLAARERKESVKPKRRRERKPKRERRRREEELYTDKDRAAAVVMGSKDIKASLNQKDKAERSNALQLPDEADAGTLLALARAEMMRGRYRTAVIFVNKAIELAPDEKAAYVARSKCYLLLGEPRLALTDAESALKLDHRDARALLRKAEALYYCGEFEMSLVHYHRGLRARPDLNDFRLGVQKAQEAIENTIGFVKTVEKPVKKKPTTQRSTSRSSKPPPLGLLMSDKIYLENLLKNPDLAIADKKNGIVLKQAEEAIRFLENREEFWRQQQTQ